MSSTPAERLRSLIERKGPQSFSRFMEEALYGEGGYYARPELPIGPAGDFVTGSSQAPLFGEVTGRLLSKLDSFLGETADYLEVGYGSGSHLTSVMATAPSERRRWLAVDRIRRPLPDGATSLVSLEEIERSSVSGLVFSYELFDALPVRRVVRRGGELFELMVDWREGGFCWAEQNVSEDDPWQTVLSASFSFLEEGQIADLADWDGLYQELASRVATGVIVTCDYGFEREPLFDARIRKRGTLACYRKQRVHRDPFAEVGAQDLTAHVNFSALIEAGEALGFETVVFTRQAAWLAAAGILDDMSERSPAERVAAMNLLDLAGMGEEIRVLVQSKGVELDALIDTSLLRSPGPESS